MNTESKEIDESFMHLALSLAARGRGKTSPNPMVGAVVVKGKEIVGRGYHHRAGKPHAEILAMRQAGSRTRGGTLYINLEPCDHFGRTPPCTRAILEAGIKRVVAGMKDPNPLVSGNGLRRLRRGGVRTEVGILERECRALNAPFIKLMQTGLPYVIWKTAASLDGKTATRTGDSRWITNEASRAYVHRLRSTVDAVLTGIGTVRKDDPLLNVRLGRRTNIRHPLRVIVDSRLRIPFDSQIVRTARDYPTLVAATRAAAQGRIANLENRGIEVAVLKSDSQGKVDLKALMKELGRREILSVLLEGGPTLNARIVEEKLVDRFLFFIAPKLIGGEKAYGIIGGEGIERMRDALNLEISNIRRLGRDLLIQGSMAR